MVLVMLAVFGCSDTQRLEATGKSSVRGINAIVDSPELNFLIEERLINSTAFKATTEFAQYDDLTYNFNFDVVLPGASVSTRLGSQFIDVLPDYEYTVVAAGRYNNPVVSFWEVPDREFDAAATVFEADFVHFAANEGEVDVYFAAVGTAPVLGAAIGSLSFGERIPYQEFTDGSYEVIVTAKDAPGTVLFHSNNLVSTPATRVTLAIFDSDPSLNADLAVNLLNTAGGSASLFDINRPAEIRLLHTAFGTSNIDGYLNSDFSTAAFANIAFGELSDYAFVSDVTMPLTITPAGNSGAPIFEQDTTSVLNARSTLIFGGDPATPLIRGLTSDYRPITPFPALRVVNMSVNASTINIYVTDPGETIDENTVAAFIGLPYPFDTGFFAPDAGMVELTITSATDATPISTPLPLTMQNGGIVDVVVRDTADPNVVEAVVFDSSP